MIFLFEMFSISCGRMLFKDLLGFTAGKLVAVLDLSDLGLDKSLTPLFLEKLLTINGDTCETVLFGFTLLFTGVWLYLSKILKIS